jgi:hypothetical protein
MDLEELSQRAREGLPLYGESHQPTWVQASAYRNSVFSQLKFCKYLVHRHPHTFVYKSFNFLAAFPMSVFNSERIFVD